MKPDALDPTPKWDVWVVVPANNEEDNIGSALRAISAALADASDRIGRSCTVVIADRCVDGTAQAAKAVCPPGELMVTASVAGNVGMARAIGVRHAQSMVPPRNPERTWIASTDADTLVPRNWLTLQLDAADRGVMGVAGIVDIEYFDELPTSARHFFATSYTAALPSIGDHPHVHAANLGVRLDAYLAAGGWNPLTRSEDRDLWNRLADTGARLESPTSLKVITSGRSVGRVPGGFADCLREQTVKFHDYVRNASHASHASHVSHASNGASVNGAPVNV